MMTVRHSKRDEKLNETKTTIILIDCHDRAERRAFAKQASFDTAAEVLTGLLRYALVVSHIDGTVHVRRFSHYEAANRFYCVLVDLLMSSAADADEVVKESAVTPSGRIRTRDLTPKKRR